jgi:hypothetical protein
MTDGANASFIDDPVKFTSSCVLLVPLGINGPWGSLQSNAQFDLRRDPNPTFKDPVYLLTTMERRGKDPTEKTNPIHGAWVPYKDGKVVTVTIEPPSHPFFIFTDKLGGCGLGCTPLDGAKVRFVHDATENVAAASSAAVHLLPEDYDTRDSEGEWRGLNTTGLAWWDGSGWRILKCRIYSAVDAPGTVGDEDQYPVDLEWWKKRHG